MGLSITTIISPALPLTLGSSAFVLLHPQNEANAARINKNLFILLLYQSSYVVSEGKQHQEYQQHQSYHLGRSQELVAGLASGYNFV